jgi:hypothetical protein
MLFPHTIPHRMTFDILFDAHTDFRMQYLAIEKPYFSSVGPT